MRAVIVLSVLIIILVAIVSIFLILMRAKDVGESREIREINRTGIGIEQINLILYDVKAYELHNPPFSKNNPKIEFIVGDDVYNSEIVKGKIITKKGIIEEPDLRIIMTEEEFVNALNSDPATYLQASVEQGKTRIEILAGNTELFAKGYLSLCQKLKISDHPKIPF